MRPVIPFFSRFPSFKTLLGQILEAYFAAFALCNIGGFSPAGILSAVLFALVFCFFSFCRRQREKKAAALPRLFDPVCRLLAVLYTLLYVAAQHQNLTGGFDSRLFRFGFAAATAAGLYFLFAACCRALMLLLASRRPRLSTAPPVRTPKGPLLFPAASLLAAMVFVRLSRRNDPGQLKPVFPGDGTDGLQRPPSPFAHPAV